MEATQREIEAAEVEVRVDEFALSQFKHLRFEEPLPDELVRIYNDFKRTKDRLNPGRLSPEGFAMVVTLYQVMVS